MSSALALAPLQKTEIPAIVDLMSQGRPDDFPLRKSPIFAWQFKLGTHPHHEGFVVGRIDGRIVGVIGTMPVEIKYQGRVRHACWNVDFFVSSSHRGRGIGNALLDGVAHRADVLLVFGLSDASQSIFKARNWPSVAHMHVFFLHLAEAGLRGTIKNARSRLAAARGRLAADERRTVSRQAPTSSELDDLWRRVERCFFSAVARTGDYLTWRYAAAPNARYDWMAAHDHGTLAAVAIFRHDPTESVLADYSGPLDDPALLRGLLRAVVEDLAARKTVRIRCEANHPAIQRALVDVGFVQARFESRLRVMSNLPGDADPTRDWFVMTGDSDNDMLLAPA